MSLPADNDPVIAGNLKASDWRAFRATLTVGGEPRRWKEAFRLYFHQRLELRYLGPIKVLQDNGTFLGEGFAIAAIQCSLVEFLAATVEGKSYVHGKKPDPDTEYRFSGEMIERFLTTAHPFLYTISMLHRPKSFIPTFVAVFYMRRL